MTKLQMVELHSLSKKDKIKLILSLWDDIALEQSIDNISYEHKKIINERLNRIDSNQAKFKPWSEVQEKYRNLQ